MAKISNTTTYPTKAAPVSADYVIGTDASSKETKTFTLQSIANLYGGSGSGTVTSVGLSAGTTGLTITSDTVNPITASGTFTLGGTLVVANGGTGLVALGSRAQSLRVNAAADGLEYTDSNVVEVVRNNTSNAILKGQPLKVVGEVAGVVSVEIATSNSSANMPCIGLAAEDIPATSNGLMIQVGMLKSININTILGTGTAAVGDIVYVAAASTPGNLLLTRDKPTGTSLIQNVGIITKTGANGDIQVTAIGRTNDLPNLQEGNIWLGDSNGAPAATINSLDNLSNVSFPSSTNDASMYIGNGTPSGLIGTPTKTTAVGEGAGVATTSGSSNTLIGTNAGLSATTGSTNTLIGSDAGDTLTTGSGNVILGAGADSNANNVNGGIAIGKNTVVNTGSVAIGESASSTGGGIALGRGATNTTANLALGSATYPLLNTIDSGDVIGLATGQAPAKFIEVQIGTTKYYMALYEQA